MANLAVTGGLFGKSILTVTLIGFTLGIVDDATLQRRGVSCTKL